jgi:hypothetical protein
MSTPLIAWSLPISQVKPSIASVLDALGDGESLVHRSGVPFERITIEDRRPQYHFSLFRLNCQIQLSKPSTSAVFDVIQVHKGS